MESTVRKPLVGHVSPETAYVVDDYPYGRTVRTSIRYWLERDERHGWRMCSQTLNPRTGKWNAPKKSTYVEYAASLYLDEKGHVHWTGLGPYGDVAAWEAFFRDFPQADLARAKRFAGQRVEFLTRLGDGRASFTINGSVVTKDEDRAKAREEAPRWAALAS